MSVSDNKKFIILKDDENGFSFKGKKPTGYTKIEEKETGFKIFYYIQNLNNNSSYNLNLIISENEGASIVCIGEETPDSNGKIDAVYEFDESLLDKVCGSAVSCKNNLGELKFPLSGFLIKKKLSNWKVNSKRLVRNLNFKKEISEVLNEVKEKVEKIEEKIENKIEDKLEDKIKEKSENLYKEYEEKLSKEAQKCKDVLKEAKDHINSIKKLLKEDSGEIERMLRSMLPSFSKKKEENINDYSYRFFYNIISSFDEVESLNFDGYSFYKVYIDDFSQMKDVRKKDEIKYGVVYYPMLSLYPYFKDKGYFLIGINYDSDKNISNIVYGVEVDKDSEKEFPYDGVTGFNRYVYDYESSKGYHIMEYDYKECRVIKEIE